MVTLESLFDRNDKCVRRTDSQNAYTSGEYEKINISDENNPKMVNLGKCCTSKERNFFIELLRRFLDVFAWSYEDLKDFRDGQFQHHIPLKPGAAPFRQKLRNYNSKVADAIFREIDKMLQARIIYPIHHCTWVANIVPVRKKNGEIRICVDFRNLNQASLKDNYPLPVMDHILQTVARSEMISMLDGFSRYNQVSVAKEDQHKTTFTTPWETFAYNCMPFSLINVGATFQRAMNLSFGHLIGKIIVVYLDDLTVFSRKREDHFKDLETVLQRCRDHGISLNPKKSVFCVTEGKLLGHIVSQDGIKIDPDHVKDIQQLSLPSDKSGVKSFFGQVSFLRRFAPDFAEITKHIVGMMSEK